MSNVRGAPAGAWSLAGVVAGLAGLATSYFVAMAMTIRESPVVAVAELVIRLTPGPVAEGAISVLGKHDKTFLVLVVLLLSTLLFAYAGRLAARSWWAPAIVFGALAVLGGVAVMQQRGAAAVDLLPVAVGLATWLVCLSLLTEPLRRGARADARGPGAGGPGRPPTRRGAHPPRLRAGRGRHARRGRGARPRRPPGGQRAPPRRGEPPAAAALGRHAAPDPGLGARRADRHLPVDDAADRVLPDPHRDRGARHRAVGVAPAHPRPGRPRGRADLPPAAGPRASPRTGSRSTASPTRSAAR